jgi:hypothetical protein
MGNWQWKGDREVPTWYVGTGSSQIAGKAKGLSEKQVVDLEVL